MVPLPHPEGIDCLHEEARERRREELRRMTPSERMEEAYRLFVLTRGGS